MPEDRSTLLSEATIGIITALEDEDEAVQTAFGCDRVPFFAHAPGHGAGRKYHVGRVPTLNNGTITVATASLVGMGNNQASARATQMRRDCPRIRHIIMTGIAGAVPNLEKPEEHVRLGDLVISDMKGVVHYDMQKLTDAGGEMRSHAHRPAAELLEALHGVPTGSTERARAWKTEIIAVCRTLGEDWNRPDEAEDRCEDTVLEPDGFLGFLVGMGKRCKKLLVLARQRQPASPAWRHPIDPRRIPGEPRVFRGPIASSNTLLKKAPLRDKLRNDHGVKAVEMEGAGIVDATWLENIGYLVVRGTCDYCDRYKGDKWQKYAAVIAAVFTRHIIAQLDGTPSTDVPPPPSGPPNTPPTPIAPTTYLQAGPGAFVQPIHIGYVGHLTNIQQPHHPQTEQALAQAIGNMRQMHDSLGAEVATLKDTIQKLDQKNAASVAPSEENIALFRQHTAHLIAQMRKARENYDLAEAVALVTETETWLRGHQTHLPPEMRREAWMELVDCETFRQEDHRNRGGEWDGSGISRFLEEFDHV